MSDVFVLAVVGLVLVAALTYARLRLVRDTTAPGRARTALTALLVLLMLTPIAADAGRQVLPSTLQLPVDVVGFGWLGYMLYLVLALLALEPLRWTLLRRSLPPGETARPAEPSPAPAESAVVADAGSAEVSRRLFLGRSLAVTAGAAAAGTVGYGTWAANSAPVVRRIPIIIPGLADELVGYRITTFSDAHLSSLYGGGRFRRLVDMVNATEPDLVAVVGDLVDGSVTDLRRDVAPLGDLVSRDGSFFVTGNHEYYVDTAAWMAHLPTLGVDVLRNERIAVTRGAASFDLAGIDDTTAADSGVPGHGANLDAALDGRDDATPVVLLAHQPVEVERAQSAGAELVNLYETSRS